MFRHLFHIALAGAVAILCPSAASVVAARAAASSSVAEAVAALSSTEWSGVNAGDLDSRLLNLALGATACAVRLGDVAPPATLTIIDYSRPSTDKRFWVFDLTTRALVYEELVAHGEGSGGNMATRFSNEPESHRSSLGLFTTDETYEGANGYSLRLNGLEYGVNDRARERAIVMHGAPYVDGDVARRQGRLGRSWGCPALRAAVAHEVIDRVKGSGIVFAYYPDNDWLQTSRYLGFCPAPTPEPTVEPVESSPATEPVAN